MKPEADGLVLGGGGSRGSYEIGVCQALDQLGYQFRYVTGTSIGALCGAIYVQGDVGKLKDWMSGFTQSSVAQNLFVFPDQYQTQVLVGQPVDQFYEMFTKNGPSIDPLREQYAKIFDFEKFKTSGMDFACMSMNATTGKAHPFFKKDMVEPDDAMNKLMSSTAYFPAFNFVQVDGDYYVDGGYYMKDPAELCTGLGASSLIGVELTDPGLPSRYAGYQNLFGIRPLLKLKYYLDFEARDLLPQISQGYLETLKYFDQAPGFLYTFYPEDWAHMTHLEELVMAFLVKLGKISLLEQMDPVMDEIYNFILGYVPQPLKNKYSGQYIFGRLLEVMGFIAGISPYEQIHFKDFINKMLDGLEHMDSNPNLMKPPVMFDEMEQKGLRDLLVFFHSALVSYDGHLPEAFQVFEAKFALPYYLGIGWYLMEKFRLLFML